MDDYRQLADKYLLHNKKRSIITILGVALTTMLIFAALNSFWSYLVSQRQSVKDEVGYTVVFYGDNMTEEIAEAIAAENCISDAYVGDYESMVIDETTGGVLTYKNALYVNYKNPYKTRKNSEKIAEQYSLMYDESELAMYYAQDSDGEGYLIALAVLILTMIMAIFGVGIIRNSIQLISLEQIKDYGILRCIGATKKQLKSYVLRMSLMLETIGIIVGLILGFIAYIPIAISFDWKISFNFIVVPVVLIAFYFDLIFVVIENTKFVNKLTPVEAVRGEFQIKKEKFKARRKSIWGVIFGVEGDYAMKSIRRNPGRFLKTVTAMGVGIGMTLAVVLTINLAKEVITGQVEHTGKYQIFYYNDLDPLSTSEYLRSELPSENYLNTIAGCRDITSAKSVYATTAYFTDYNVKKDHIDENWEKNTYVGSWAGKWPEKVVEAADGLGVNTEDFSDNEFTDEDYSSDEMKSFLMRLQYATSEEIIGYDEDDYENLKSELKDGSLDLSEDGIIWVNGVYSQSTSDEDNEALMGTFDDFEVADYKVGDTVEFVDMSKFRENVSKRMQEDGVSTYVEMKEEKDGLEDYTTSVADYTKVRQIWFEEYTKLLKAGETKTYTIEAILEKDPNMTTVDNLDSYGRFILPLDRYFEETGSTEDDMTGMMYSKKGTKISGKLSKAFTNNLYDYASDGGNYTCDTYLSSLVVVNTYSKVVLVVMGVVLFIVFLSFLNILNTTASNLHLRRKELAQLRVIGMSKRRLTFTVMLEGIIAGIGSNILGIILGLLALKYVRILFNALYVSHAGFPVVAYIIVVIMSFVLLCAAEYFPLRNLKSTMAEDLVESDM